MDSGVTVPSNFEFNNCDFKISDKGVLILSKNELTDCTFHGQVDSFLAHSNEGSLIFNEAILIDCTITGEYNQLNFVKSDLNDITENSHAKTFQAYGETEMLNCKILGSCKTLHLDSCIIRASNKRKINKKSIWNKEIRLNANCNNTVFSNIRVHPYYLSTKCHDKNSIDLSDAKLIDDWSRLRKNYSGISLFIVFLLSFLFFLPLFTKSFFLIIVSKTPIPPEFPKSTLGEVIFFGGDSGIKAIIHFALTTTLLIYNSVRIYLTIAISKLREEEKFLSDANFQIVSISPNKYKFHLRLDKVLRYLFWVSFIYSIYKFAVTLFIEVPSIY